MHGEKFRGKAKFRRNEVQIHAVTQAEYDAMCTEVTRLRARAIIWDNSKDIDHTLQSALDVSKKDRSRQQNGCSVHANTHDRHGIKDWTFGRDEYAFGDCTLDGDQGTFRAMLRAENDPKELGGGANAIWQSFNEEQKKSYGEDTVKVYLDPMEEFCAKYPSPSCIDFGLPSAWDFGSYYHNEFIFNPNGGWEDSDFEFMAPPLHRFCHRQEDTEIEEIDTDTLRKNQSSQYDTFHHYRPQKRRRTLSERLEELCLSSNDANMESASFEIDQADTQEYERQSEMQLSSFHRIKRPYDSRYLISKQSEAARTQTNRANNLIFESLVSQYLASEISSLSTDLVIYHPKPEHSRFYASNLGFRARGEQNTQYVDDYDGIDCAGNEDVDMKLAVPKVPRLANSVTHSEWFTEAQEEL
ncbi:hypothetical protein ABG067_001163 [Albugo candida]